MSARPTNGTAPAKPSQTAARAQPSRLRHLAHARTLVTSATLRARWTGRPEDQRAAAVGERPALRIAVVGGGIAGLSAAWLLARRHEVTLLEAETRLGGHAWTLEVPGPDGPLPVDIGFTVYNEVTYPLLTRLLAHLGVTGEAAPMTFSVTIGDGELAYAGGSFRSVLAQPWNAVRPRYLGMLHDIARFNHLAWRHLRAGEEEAETLREFLARHRFGHGLQEWYLLPLAASIWSAPIARILDFPVQSLLAFLANHGLLRVGRRLRWRTVGGGSRVLVGRLAAALESRVRPGAAGTGVRRAGGGGEVGGRGGRGGRVARAGLGAPGRAPPRL